MTVTVRTGLELCSDIWDPENSNGLGCGCCHLQPELGGCCPSKALSCSLKPTQTACKTVLQPKQCLSLPLCLKLAVKQDWVFSQSPILCELRQLLPRVTAGWPWCCYLMLNIPFPDLAYLAWNSRIPAPTQIYINPTKCCWQKSSH